MLLSLGTLHSAPYDSFGFASTRPNRNCSVDRYRKLLLNFFST